MSNAKDVCLEDQALTDADGQKQGRRRAPSLTGTGTSMPEDRNALCNTLHTEEYAVAMDCIQKLCAGHPQPMVGAEDADLALKTLFEMEPQTPMERMLMTQMIQTSNAAARCMNGGFREGVPFKEQNEYLGLATKFHRTFVAQIEALQKLRGKGGQHVRVEHVHVYEGGQAIVGNVEHTPGGAGGGHNGK